MAKIEIFLKFLKKWEGGFVNDPSDAGGATNRGVTLTTYRLYKHKQVTLQDLRNMSEAEWKDIVSLYWAEWKADVIKSQEIANMLVDWLWCSGIHGIKIPQRILGVPDDGIVGERTLRAVNSTNSTILKKRLMLRREDFLYSILQKKKTQEKFIQGWLNRLKDLEENYV